MSTATGDRRLWLAASRAVLLQLPHSDSPFVPDKFIELPGRPHVVCHLRSYHGVGDQADKRARQAREDFPFLFKAFETGQIGPKRLQKLANQTISDKPRACTIHEYLDWTVTAQAADTDEELDFGGFLILLISHRYKSHWPAPGVFQDEGKRCTDALGARHKPLPALMTHNKPVCVATIRAGPGYLEVPFVATHETKRGRGFGRCMVEAIEEVARACNLPKILLCSTNDEHVKNTWRHLGYHFTTEEDMEGWNVRHTDLVYLQNTTQMHKDVPPPQQFKPIILKHGTFKQRLYAEVKGAVASRSTAAAAAMATAAKVSLQDISPNSDVEAPSSKKIKIEHSTPADASPSPPPSQVKAEVVTADDEDLTDGSAAVAKPALHCLPVPATEPSCSQQASVPGASATAPHVHTHAPDTHALEDMPGVKSVQPHDDASKLPVGNGFHLLIDSSKPAEGHTLQENHTKSQGCARQSHASCGTAEIEQRPVDGLGDVRDLLSMQANQAVT